MIYDVADQSYRDKKNPNIESPDGDKSGQYS